jgi:hypothetical protein
MINAEIFTPDDLTYAVDTLADIRAQIAELKAREDTFKAVLIAAGHAADVAYECIICLANSTHRSQKETEWLIGSDAAICLNFTVNFG